jgi:hypothetical protein
MLMECSLKGLVRPRHVVFRHVVFKSWLWGCGTRDLFGMSVLWRKIRNWRVRTLHLAETKDKTMPLFLLLLLRDCSVFLWAVWTIKVNSIWRPSLAFNSCSALFCLLFLRLPYPVTDDVLSRRVTKLFHMIHMLLLTRILEMFFY